jgi:diguanylate cyclase (GGDEF)-like protein
MTTKPRSSRNRFLFLIALAALTCLGYDAWASQGRALLGPHPVALGLFAGCCLVTELRPLRWLRLEEGGQVTASWTFMMALILIGTPAAAVGAASGIVLISDLVSRKGPAKVIFNTSQIIVCMTLGSAAFTVGGQGEALLARGGPSMLWFVDFAAACAIIFGLNNALTGSVMALDQGLPVVPMLRSIGVANLETDGILLSLSPVFVVVAERSVLLIPLLLVTTWTVYRTAEVALVRRHEATHDMLTQLPNRRLFDEHLQNAVISAQRKGTRVAVVLIDLDGFKGINDRLGHDIGDQVLRDIAARMNDVRRSRDLLARIGGDEFAMIITHVESVSSVVQLAKRLRDTFARPSDVQGFPVSVSGSFGIAVLPDHAETAGTLLKRADESMYAAKRGDELIGVPEQRSGERAIGRIGLLADVAGALVANEFFLEYQPQISLVGGGVTGVEALVRWRHPVAGVLYPSEFIGLAEQTELIGDITERVLRLALNQCATWRSHGHDLRMAVNISARNLQDLHFPQLVQDLLVESGVEPSNIDLEITENTVGVDSSTLHWILTKLRATGVSISIDDFGTGYSSMAQLRQLPVDRIKIDRSFVTNMARQSRDALIVGAIIQLGLALGIQTIAEGVEDPDVAEMLLTLGCTSAQGWLYGKPTSADILSRLLDDLLVPAPLHLAILEASRR